MAYYTVTYSQSVSPTPTPTPVPTPTPTPVPTPTPTPTPPPPLPSGTALWFHVQPAASAVAPNAPLTLTITPVLGKWPVTGTFTLASSIGGTFGPITVPYGSYTPITTTFTPSAPGYHILSCATNTLGIKAPVYHCGITVFAPSQGSLATFSADSTKPNVIKDASIWERDVRVGGMGAGWSSAFTKGWARVDLPVALSGSTTAIWMRLYDAMSAGADPAGSGSGTLLQSPVQIAGTTAGGFITLQCNLPGSGTYYYVEFATDQAFTNPYRVPKRLGVGHRIAFTSRSYGYTMVSSWQYNGVGGLPNYLTLTGGYGLASTYCNGPLQLGALDWVLCDGVPTPSNSPGIMEIARIMSGATGVLTGMFGYSAAGGDVAIHMSDTGKLAAFNANGLAGGLMINAATNGLVKFAYALIMERDGEYSEDWWYYNYSGFADQMTAVSGSPVITCFDIVDNVHSGTNSGPVGYGRVESVMTQLSRDRRDVVVAGEPAPGLNNSHDDINSKVIKGRGIARALLSREDGAFGGGGGDVKGPRFATTGGTRAAGSYTMRLPVEHRGGGSALMGVKVAETDLSPPVYSTPSSAEWRTLFSVRLRGNRYDRGRRTLTRHTWQTVLGVAIQLDAANSVTINNATNEVWVTLDSSSPGNITFVDGTTMPLTDDLAFSLAYHCDYDTSINDPSADVNGHAYWLTDNNTDVSGYPAGYPMQREIGYHVEAPSPPAQRALINPVLSTITGGWLEATGPVGSGTPISTLNFQIDSSPRTPSYFKILDDNTWWMRCPAPATDGAHLLTVSRPNQGSPDASSAFTTGPVSQFLGVGSDYAYINLSPGAAASYVESYSAFNRGAQWADTALTVHPTKGFDQIARWDGDTGNAGNRLGQAVDQFNRPYHGPLLNFHEACVYAYPAAYNTGSTAATANVKDSYTIGARGDWNAVLLGSCAPLLGRMLGDFTVLGALRVANVGLPWALANRPGSGGAISDGTLIGVGAYNNSWRRGSNVSTGAVVSTGQTTTTLLTHVMRYTAATGTLDVFSRFHDGSGSVSAPAAATHYSNQTAPEAISFDATYSRTGLTITPVFGSIFSLMFFNSAFGGDLTTGDVKASLDYLLNRWDTATQ